MKVKFPEILFITKDREDNREITMDWLAWSEPPGNFDGEQIAIYRQVSVGTTELNKPTIHIKVQRKRM